MTDFLLELRSEEIPARMQDKARDDLARLFTAELAKAGLAAGAIVTYATPRRLALIARDLPLATQAVSEETKGPRSSAPPQALEGFLRKTGLTQDQLVDRDGIYYAVVDKPGRATAAVLAEAIPAIIRAFPWPKSMRWGDASLSTESLRWVRPLQGIIALLGDDVVPCTIAGVESGATTVGHRFHHPAAITIGSAGDYVEKLRDGHVIVDQNERRATIAVGAKMAANKAGLVLVEDEGLVTENAGLTEYPVPLLGRFDPAFLDVPPEVIQLTARVNQKYFVCRDAEGKLANAFVCTANIGAADDGAKIVEGNRKVLAARLSDARHFFDEDQWHRDNEGRLDFARRKTLDEHASKLSDIVFHEKLGTLADKVERVAKLARWLVEEGIVGAGPEKPLSFRGGVGGGASPSHRDPAIDGSPPVDSPHPNPSPEEEGRATLADLAERAARLAKADLVTGMVGEFPELQGLMGGYYAAAQGEHPAVAAAIRDHYKPVGQGDDVPTDPVTVAVSLADKLDTIFAFFAIEERPSGSRDPFALRRAALSSIRLLTENNVRLDLLPIARRAAIDIATKILSAGKSPANTHVIKHWCGTIDSGSQKWRHELNEAEVEAVDKVLGAVAQTLDFFADRLKVQQREAGVRHDLIDAVFALGGEDDLVRLLARVKALQAFVGTEDGANLLAGYKRASNILKKEGYDSPAAAEGRGTAPDYTAEPAEAALRTALDSAAPAAAQAVAAEDFAAAMAALASLRAPIDTFFECVIVNDPDPAKRLARLNLLARVRDAVHGVADFSRIEG